MQDERLRLYLSDSEKNGVTIKIYHPSQKTITNEMKHKGDTVPTLSKILSRVTRSDVTEFSWQTHCFCCGSPCVPDPKHPECKKIRNACILPFKKTCDEKIDKGTLEVRAKVLDCHD